MSDIKRLTSAVTSADWRISNGGQYVLALKGAFDGGTVSTAFRFLSADTTPANVDVSILDATADASVSVTLPDGVSVVSTLTGGAGGEDIDILLRRAG